MDRRRREIAKIYNKGLSGVSGLELPPAPNSDKIHYDIFQNYVIRVLTPDSGGNGRTKKRDELFEYLKEKGVETLIKDPIPNHWQKGLSLSHFKLPYSEQLAKKVISLPMYPELTNKQIDYTINCLKSFLANVLIF